MKYWTQVFLVGMAIFSMFFGGGNLVFPIWIGTQTQAVGLSSLGFILSGVLIPFFGIIIVLYFQGNHERYLGVWGKNVGRILMFSLLLFWIPLGSGPRCNQLAYGAFCQIGGGLGEQIPLWLYSALYSAIVYVLTLRKGRFLGVLGKVITPMLIFSLFFLIFSIVKNSQIDSFAVAAPNAFFSSFFAGYNTMDFIAAIFFSSTLISLVKEKHQDKFNIRFIRHACLFAIILLSIIYVGMISVGYANAELLSNVSRDQLLAVIGKAMFSEKFEIIIFLIITLSVLSTSMALSLVCADYLRDHFFKGKWGHAVSLFLAIMVSFVTSIIGFERLAVLISYAMSFLYPLLLVITSYAFCKAVYEKKNLTRSLNRS